MYYTYMLRCTDNSIYTGITTDLERRMNEHFSQDIKAAKYTKRHKPKKLETAWYSENKVSASKLEYHIKKRLSKKQKEALIENYKLLKKYEFDKINATEYKKVRKNSIEKLNTNLNLLHIYSDSNN